MMNRIALGAYQYFDIEWADLGDQYTNGGTEPRTARIRLTTAMDEPFIPRTVTALLSEEGQRRIIAALQENLGL